MKLIIAGMAVASLTPFALAGTTITALVRDDGTTGAGTIGEFTGQTDSTPLGLARLSSGSYLYWEDNAAGTGAQSLIRFDPDLSGAARFSVLLSEVAARVVTGAGSPEAFEGVAVDPDTDDVYLGLWDNVNGPHYIVRIPSLGLGTDTFGPPVLAANGLGIGNFTTGNGLMMIIDPTTTPNSIITMRDDAVLANDVAINGIYRRLVTDAPSTPSTLVASFGQLAGGLTPSTDAEPGTDALGFRALAVVLAGPDAGDFIVSHGLGTGGADADVVRWDLSAGAAVNFLDNATHTPALGTNRNPLVSLSNGTVAMWNVSGTEEGVWVYSSTGPHTAPTQVVATDADITTAVTGTPVGQAETLRQMATDGAQTIAIFQTADQEALIELVDPTLPAELSVFSAN